MAYNELLPSRTSTVNISDTERIVSIAAGTFMLFRGLYGLEQKPFRSTVSIIAGTWMIIRGTTGNCVVNNVLGRSTATSTPSTTLQIKETITIRRPRHEVYTYWRMLENLPDFMKHLQQVTQTDSIHSHWKARIPLVPVTLEWDATIIQELANESIAWRSDEGAMIENAGEIEFITLPDGGTEIRADISYRPPAGEAGRLVASMLNKTFEQLIREDLQRFKTMLESHKLTLSNAESQAQLE